LSAACLFSLPSSNTNEDKKYFIFCTLHLSSAGNEFPLAPLSALSVVKNIFNSANHREQRDKTTFRWNAVKLNLFIGLRAKPALVIIFMVLLFASIMAGYFRSFARF